MSNQLQVTGKLLVKYDKQQVSERFAKREFVVELAEERNGETYTNFGKFQLVQNKCEILDRFNEGDNILVSFNIKGNKWERDGKVNYITSLDAWRIEAAGAGAMPTNQSFSNNASQADRELMGQQSSVKPLDETQSDLPF